MAFEITVGMKNIAAALVLEFSLLATWTVVNYFFEVIFKMRNRSLQDRNQQGILRHGNRQERSSDGSIQDLTDLDIASTSENAEVAHDENIRETPEPRRCRIPDWASSLSITFCSCLTLPL